MQGHTCVQWMSLRTLISIMSGILQDSETVYFEEGLKTAQKAVADALEKYKSLLGSLSEEERGKLQRSMGLKMEQLKVRFQFRAGKLPLMVECRG